ncbi:NAD(P)H-dependent oxidoreductase subunit E [Spirochaetota bacterium]
MAQKESVIEKITGKYENDPDMLIPMMQDIQKELGYLPKDQLEELSKDLNISMSRIYSVATFYASFRLAPKGQHDIILCMGTVCYLKGSKKIMDMICDEYKINPGDTTEDRLFTLSGVNCVGACALAPVMIVDGKYHDGVSPDKALKIIKKLDSTSKKASEKAK